MMNIKDWLNGAEIKEIGFLKIKEELGRNYSFELVRDIMSLPCMQYSTQLKLSLMIAHLEDKVVNDTVIGVLCQILSDIPIELWRKYRESLNKFIEENYSLLSRSQLLLLAHTIEVMYARGYENTFQLLSLIYQRIALHDYEFNPDSDDNVRIKLAKIAYSASVYNIQDKLDAISAIKYHIKASGRKYLLGVLNYYKGLCLKVANHKIGYKDCEFYMLKARQRGFELAYIYQDYSLNNLETSKGSAKLA